ncbi:class I SAM-dependent methyltransferase [Actinomycetia phage DSL-LC01]|nr:class I SAM-dependent methyltransferase [Actinomycetia phage DSL-LC01]
MPRSDTSNRAWVASKITDLYPDTFLDVGPGEGAYGKLVREHSPLTVRHAVEIWAPYVETYRLESIYHKVFICDARIFFNYKYDLVILGDVLEHMSRDEAKALWSIVGCHAKAAIISMPIIHYPQGEEEGNPYEAHVEEDWTHEEILETFDGIEDHERYAVTASYFARFDS